MCWSGEASTVLATIGFGGCAYAAYKKEPPALWVCLGYFSLMEALQAYTYTVIDKCWLPSNQIATFLGYLHIVYQPFFVNLFSMHFIPKSVREKIQIPVYCLCFAASIFMIIQLYPFDWAGVCEPGRPLCGKTLCSVRGNWHIAWNIPLNGIWNSIWDTPILGYIIYGAPYSLHAAWDAFINTSILTWMFLGGSPYFFVCFFIPAIYGAWRIALFYFVVGPILAVILTNGHPNEQPAVWCLLSIGMLLFVIETPLRKIFYVKKWFFYPK